MNAASLDSTLNRLLEQMHQHLDADEIRAAVGLLDTCDPSLKKTGTWLNARGMIAFRMGELGVANDYFEQALQAHGPEVEILCNLGAVHLELAKGSAGPQQREAYTAALSRLQEALKLAPDSPNVLTNLALAYTLAGDMSRAEFYLDRALANAPRHSSALFQKAQLLSDRGSLADALKLIDTILEELPGQQEALAQRHLILDRLSF